METTSRQPNVEASNVTAYSNDPSEKFWSIYVKKTADVDKDLVEEWKGTTDGILIFAGLFSAVITAFITESYQLLSPDSQENAAAALMQISLQLAAMSNGSQAGVTVALPYTRDTFAVPRMAIWTNVLWFLSLSSSLICALAATLVQMWARDYKQTVERHHNSRKRGTLRAYLYHGLVKFGMSGFMDAIPALLHASVFLFLAGLFLFLYPIYRLIGSLLFGVFVASTALYVLTSLVPLVVYNYPFHTPLTNRCLWIIHKFRTFGYTLRILLDETLTFIWHIRRYGIEFPLHPIAVSNVLPPIVHGAFERRANAALSDYTAITGAWDFLIGSAKEDHEIDEFLDALPGFYEAENSQPALPLLFRKLFKFRPVPIVRFFLRTSHLDDDRRTRRIIRCFHAISSIVTTSHTLKSDEVSAEMRRMGLYWWFYNLCKLFKDPNQVISTHALITSAFVISGTQRRSYPSLRLPLSEVLSTLQNLRAFQLGHPSPPADGQQDPMTSNPFEVVIGCVAQHSRTLRDHWTEVYERMIQSNDVGMERSFASVVGILLHALRYVNLDEVTESLCEPCVYLTDPDAVKVVRQAFDVYMRKMPHHSAIAEIYRRLPVVDGPDDQVPVGEGGGGVGVGEGVEPIDRNVVGQDGEGLAAPVELPLQAVGLVLDEGRTPTLASAGNLGGREGDGGGNQGEDEYGVSREGITLDSPQEEPPRSTSEAEVMCMDGDTTSLESGISPVRLEIMRIQQEQEAGLVRGDQMV